MNARFAQDEFAESPDFKLCKNMFKFFSKNVWFGDSEMFVACAKKERRIHKPGPLPLFTHFKERFAYSKADTGFLGGDISSSIKVKYILKIFISSMNSSRQTLPKKPAVSASTPSVQQSRARPVVSAPVSAQQNATGTRSSSSVRSPSRL